MNIHEYQAKQLFAEFGVAVPKGWPAKSADDFDAALANFPDGAPVVVKSQIHAGGRGKGAFTNGLQRGVVVAKSKADAKAAAAERLGQTLVTKQTGAAGRVVRTIYFESASQITKEYYLAILLDRATSRPVIVASTEGGMSIEEVAEKTPEKIVKVRVDPALGLQPFQKNQLAYALGFTDKDLVKQFAKLITALYNLFWEKDCSMVEINPLAVTTGADGKPQLTALDAKVGFDDNALFRHPEVVALRDPNEEDPKEIAAGEFGLNYIALDGSIACLVNGAGLAMATMDIIKHYGGEPANFLDVGGGASKEAVAAAFKIILSDANVRGILVNIFGGIMDCDVIAQGIVAAVHETGLKLPLVVRLEGNNVENGKKTLAAAAADLPTLNTAGSMADAAEKIVALVK
ncbi:MAG: ADP-forming succinate--CoA ligase subunit beta [Puniceicoccales bacterium]|jgi:succinyl-CoA synthetase beta subunit|nr:ADP-forming succinate--CoA ligase subunit beta [Puniceicoccales bacterium]